MQRENKRKAEQRHSHFFLSSQSTACFCWTSVRPQSSLSAISLQGLSHKRTTLSLCFMYRNSINAFKIYIDILLPFSASSLVFWNFSALDVNIVGGSLETVIGWIPLFLEILFLWCLRNKSVGKHKKRTYLDGKRRGKKHTFKETGSSCSMYLSACGSRIKSTAVFWNTTTTLLHLVWLCYLILWQHFLVTYPPKC